MRPPEPDLRKHYLDEKLPTRQVAAIYGVSHMAVKRWLRHYGIPARAANRGLENRGVTPPTAAELEEMIHVKHMPYREVAELYGVDGSAVQHWLTKHGIRKPKTWDTRRKGIPLNLPSVDELRERHGRGDTIKAIATEYGVSDDAIRVLCDEHGLPIGLPGWPGVRRWECSDGHLVDSVNERHVDEWLTANGLAHEPGPRLPFAQYYRADFRVGDAYIEVWGVSRSDSYQERRAKKTALYRAKGVQFVGLEATAFSAKHGRPFADLLAAAFLEERAA